MSVSEKPPEPDSSPSGEPEAEADTGEPKTPASGKSPFLAPTPKVHVAPPAAPDASVSPTQDADGRWSFEIGEVLDLGARSGRLVGSTGPSEQELGIEERGHQ